MDAQTLNQTFDLAAVIPGLKKRAKYHAGPCPFCGGRDRFVLKHTPTGDRWFCRQCGDGRYHTAVDFYMQLWGMPFKDTLVRLGGEVITHAHAKVSPRPAVPFEIELPARTWQAEAFREIDAASDRLLVGEPGEPGRRYLTQRGFHRGTMNAWHLGYGVAYDQPAIMIPWMDGDNVITAVKYRFIEAKDKGARFAMRKGSKPYLFGLTHIFPSHKTLLLVEGELNAISVWQCQPKRVAVVSCGSEANGDPELLRALARRFERVVIWTDDPDKGKALRVRMDMPAELIKSPHTLDKKWDANFMLQNDLLAHFITGMLGVECMGIRYALRSPIANVTSKPIISRGNE